MSIERINQNFVLISQTIDVWQFVTTSKSIISVYDYEDIEARETRIEKNEWFLLNIEMYGTDVIREFITFLDLNYDLPLTGAKDKAPASGKDYTWVRRRLVLFKSRLNPRIVAPLLFEAKYISKHTLERIMVSKTSSEKKSVLMNDMRSMSAPGMIDKFISIIQTHQPDLYESAIAVVS